MISCKFPAPRRRASPRSRGALDEFDQLDDVVRDIYSARGRAKDRPAPILD